MTKHFIYRHQGQYLWADIRVTYDTATGEVLEIGMTPKILENLTSIHSLIMDIEEAAKGYIGKKHLEQQY